MGCERIRCKWKIYGHGHRSSNQAKTKDETLIKRQIISALYSMIPTKTARNSLLFFSHL
ncbi:hypothetical protein PJ15_3438 [Acinetobacter sp. neg1]|nr:hypothetical protein PJ15_3438 [Acinetobacter sp. neg1]